MADVRDQMFRSLRGELTEQTATYFAHPKHELNANLSALAALGYAIADKNHEDIALVLRESNEFLLNQLDYSGNTPLVRITIHPHHFHGPNGYIPFPFEAAGGRWGAFPSAGLLAVT